MPLPILQKLLGHSSIRTTALYWRDIYQGNDNGDDAGSILVGKKWLENGESPKPPSTENFPKIPKNPKPIFIDQRPVISNENLTGEYNSLSVPKTLKKALQILINEISPGTAEKFSLSSIGKNSDQLKVSQPLAVIANNEEKPTKKEAILLAKIGELEKQLKQTQQLVHQEKQRADNYQQQLRSVVKVLKQWQKINYYQQLEQEKTRNQAQIIQSPLTKLKN